MTVDELLARVRAEMHARADEDFRRGVVNFFVEPVNPHGVRSPDVKAIARIAHAEVKRWPAAQRLRFANELWKSGRLEEGSLAIVIYRRLAKQAGAAEFAVFERWLDRYVHNWANCDGVASWLLAGAIANEPELIARLRPWAASKNRWKRRAAIVAMLQEAKQGRNTAAIFELADALLRDPDQMVQKGVGWVLKQTYPKRPRELMAFLLPRAAQAPRLVLRIAAEKMSAPDRAVLL
ncbi:MAG: DNA alkylation repair protein [Acidobacteriota bacterium]